MAYNLHNLEEEHEKFHSTLTQEQRVVYDTIIESVYKDEGGTFFLYGYGGTGKTFVWKTLVAAIHSRGHIVINVAYSGITALLLTGGRTTHSRFAIPINVVEDSFCSIQADSELAALLNKAKLIIWNEAPMMHMHCFEAFDRTLRDIIRSPNKSKLFRGDFRQIHPVIQRGTRSKIVHALIHSSHLWSHCEVLRLTKNTRLMGGTDKNQRKEISDFADCILRIGEGNINEPNDGEAYVQFPEDVLVRFESNHIQTIVNSIYPSLRSNLVNPKYFQERAILAPTNEDVATINDHILSTLYTDECVYFSSDCLS